MYLALILGVRNQVSDGGLIDRGRRCVRTATNGRWSAVGGCMSARVYRARGSVDVVSTAPSWCWQRW
ncbi:hypothetical protein ES332_D09G070500v1 [Gossypium tomentosum]|uniref:Uncharacterized protein n=1 Tax=Gossypium tomentosum TaxID=34277 RepID=A0A5D2JEU8_GOSTO|nr:hypothetical protein ES332_D09G070500v1 [Gossypium tomentosum]